MFRQGGGIQVVSDTLLGMLRSGDRDEASIALLFIENVIRFGLVDRSQALRMRSRVLPGVRDLVYAPDHNLRSNSVVTLERIGPRTNVGLLMKAFPYYLDHDPIALPHLLRSIARLTGATLSWGHIYSAASSPLYLTRWSLLGVVDSVICPPGNPHNGRIARFCKRLMSDEHPLVRAEAAYTLDILHKTQAYLARSEEDQTWPAEAEELLKGQPAITFLGICAAFWHYLDLVGERDYEVETLDVFVQYRLSHPIPKPLDATKPVDVDSYAWAFHASRCQDPTPPQGRHWPESAGNGSGK